MTRTRPRGSVRRHRHPAAGFMLVEVVIAVALFAFAAIGFATALNRLLDVEKEVRRERRVRLELESRLAQARLEAPSPGRKELGKDVEGFSYVQEIEEPELKNEDGQALGDILLLRVIALDLAGEEYNRAEIYRSATPEAM